MGRKAEKERSDCIAEEGPVYSRGRNFRACAELSARKYRLNILHLTRWDTWGHWLHPDDACNGYNFLPAMRSEILSALKLRAAKGKGIDLDRTRKNLLSSQALCFNLFIPLNKNKELASRLFKRLLRNNDAEITDDIILEYTPSNSIFGDQSAVGGVDCDALVIYQTSPRQRGLIVVETKYVETGFSICGFRRSYQKDPCPKRTFLNDDYSTCRYNTKKKYRYWDRTQASRLFNMDLIKSQPCPFGDSLWQLWTNMTLSFCLAEERDIEHFSYVIICPKQNTSLSNNGEVFRQFGHLIRDEKKNAFKVIFLEDIIENLLALSNDFPTTWIRDFQNRYHI